MARLVINSEKTFGEAINDFLFIKKTEGLSPKTLQGYKNHLNIITHYIDGSTLMDDLDRKEIQCFIIKMQEKGQANNTIASYVRVLKTFLSWARSEGLTDITIPNYKAEETVKETYSDEELARLLKKPNMKHCKFSEYRTWVIINFLMNSGARAATVRCILIQDVDLENRVITYRHTKNKKVQIIPLCTQMCNILNEYMRYRKGEPNDYLFCCETGEQLTEYGLRNSIVRYNRRRGVNKTSTHLFRHTFAKKYLIDCGGDAFTLQRLLGHSTLEMTRHYCNIYNADLVKNFDDHSPLQMLNTNEKRITLK